MIDNLSLREMAGQLVFPRLGSNMPPPVTAAEDAERFESVLDECPVGGIIVFNGSYPETPRALASLQRRSRIPLLVCADMERGAGQQIRGATVFPHAMAFSAAGADGERLLDAAARIHAREALASGIHVTFSPDADVNRDPRNPIIGTRAFGREPSEAARLVRIFVRACREEGLLCTAKHFPGHGNTSSDSHSETPVVRSSRDELEAFDLIPFRAAVEEGVDFVMSAHVKYPALDDKHPATLSKFILCDLLRKELGFKGIVVTDSLLMGAVRESHGTPGEQAAALVRAGVDVLLDVPDPLAAVDGITASVEQGTLDRTLVEQAARRVLRLKERLRSPFADFADPDSLPIDDAVGSASSAALAEEAARAAVTVVGSGSELPPLPSSGDGVFAVLVRPHRSRFDPPVSPFARAIGTTFPAAIFKELHDGSSAEEYREARELASNSRYIVAAVVVKPAAWHAFGLTRDQDSWVREVLPSTPSILISLGSPYVLDDYPNAAMRLCTFSDVAVSQQAAVDWLAART